MPNGGGGYLVPGLMQQAFIRSRVLLSEGGQLHSLLWIDRSQGDGSVYVGPFDPSTRDVEVAILEQRSEEPTMDVLYPSFEARFELCEAPKISFHPAQRGLAAQIHLRGSGATKTPPIILDRWDVLKDSRRSCGLVVLPETNLLPSAGPLNPQTDIALPLHAMGRRAYGGEFSVAPVGVPIVARTEAAEGVAAVALFESAYGHGALILNYDQTGRGGAPFLVFALTSKGTFPYRTVSVGFRIPSGGPAC
jgi:hypothetical protein